jgi:transcription elongation factor GreA
VGRRDMANRNIRPNKPPQTLAPEGEKETILTESGLRKLEEELEHLKGTRRKEVAERIKQAKEFGDLFENAEYDDAKNEQAFVEGRILQLEQMLRNARIIENAAGAGVVVVGSTVRVRDMAGGEEIAYTIVGSAEADPLQDLISNESPVGQALIGRKKGDTITVRVPAGTLKYQILDIAH